MYGTFRHVRRLLRPSLALFQDGIQGSNSVSVFHIISRSKNTKTQHKKAPSVGKVREKWVSRKHAHFTGDNQGGLASEFGSADETVDDFTRVLDRQRLYSAADAIDLHREMAAAVGYNGVYMVARLELNMTTDKKNRYRGNIRDLVLFPHYFEDGPLHNVILICKRAQHMEIARKSNCFLYGHEDILKKFQSGEILDYNYDFLICTPDVYADVIKYRKKINPDKFPSQSNGRLSADVAGTINRFTHGKMCESSKITDTAALLRVNFGTASMTTEQLVENFNVLIQEIEVKNDPAEGNFITSARISYPPSLESFCVDISELVESARGDEDEKEAQGRAER